MAKIKVEYRDIAKMLAKSLPVEGSEFKDAVENNLKALKKMSQESKVALKSAYIFSSKAPKQDREDLFQELAIAILEAKTKDEPLAYSIARCDWRNWWQKRMTRANYLGGSLNKTVSDGEGNEVELGELLVGEVEFEAKICDKLEASRLWNKLPEIIKPIIQNRLLGIALVPVQRQQLSRYLRKDGYKLLIA